MDFPTPRRFRTNISRYVLNGRSSATCVRLGGGGIDSSKPLPELSSALFLIVILRFAFRTTCAFLSTRNKKLNLLLIVILSLAFWTTCAMLFCQTKIPNRVPISFISYPSLSSAPSLPPGTGVLWFVLVFQRHVLPWRPACHRIQKAAARRDARAASLDQLRHGGGL
jgi:hypothetical protein